MSIKGYNRRLGKTRLCCGVSQPKLNLVAQAEHRPLTTSSRWGQLCPFRPVYRTSQGCYERRGELGTSAERERVASGTIREELLPNRPPVPESENPRP